MLGSNARQPLEGNLRRGRLAVAWGTLGGVLALGGPAGGPGALPLTSCHDLILFPSVPHPQREQLLGEWCGEGGMAVSALAPRPHPPDVPVSIYIAGAPPSASPRLVCRLLPIGHQMAAELHRSHVGASGLGDWRADHPSSRGLLRTGAWA